MPERASLRLLQTSRCRSIQRYFIDASGRIKAGHKSGQEFCTLKMHYPEMLPEWAKF